VKIKSLNNALVTKNKRNQRTLPFDDKTLSAVRDGAIQLSEAPEDLWQETKPKRNGKWMDGARQITCFEPDPGNGPPRQEPLRAARQSH
jgi:hypothetical protein